MFVANGERNQDFGTVGVEDVDEKARNRLWRRVARTFLPGRVRRRLHMWFGDFWIAYRKDRRYLDRELIPAVGRRGGRALFIGCRKYTNAIRHCLRHTAWTAGPSISTQPPRAGARRNGT